MPFINGMQVPDVTGRATLENAVTNAGDPFMAARRYNSASANPQLEVNPALGNGAPFSFVAGQKFDVNGRMCVVTNSVPQGSDVFVNGLRYAATGELRVDTGTPQVGWVHGWPVDANGVLCIN